MRDKIKVTERFRQDFRFCAERSVAGAVDDKVGVVAAIRCEARLYGSVWPCKKMLQYSSSVQKIAGTQ